MQSGDLARAEVVLIEQLDRATRAGEDRLRAHGAVALAILARSIHPEAVYDEKGISDAIEVFNAAGDDHGLAIAYLALARPRWDEGKVAVGDELAGNAVVHARRAGDAKTVTRVLGNLGLSAVVGPMPTSAGLRLCEEYAIELTGRKIGEARLGEARAMLLAMRGDFDEARALLGHCGTISSELGMAVDAGALAQCYGELELAGDDPAAAESELRAGYEELEALGERSYSATIAAQLAQVVAAQGRGAEAEHYATLAERETADDDVVSQAWVRSARAKARAADGDMARAEPLARGGRAAGRNGLAQLPGQRPHRPGPDTVRQ